MQDILKILDALRLAYHTAHHYATGQAYFGDHAFFGEGYLAAQSDFDALFERSQTLGLEIEEPVLAGDAAAVVTFQRATATPETLFAELLKMEEALCGQIEREEPENSVGTRTLLGDIANASEARQGHIKRRVK